jgi:hypothetical protein
LLNYTMQYCMHMHILYIQKSHSNSYTLFLTLQKIGYAHFAQAQLCEGQPINYFRGDI